MRWILLLSLAAASWPAAAEVERYAILAGNNRGARDEPNLRYAEDDATKLGRALIEVSAFAPENVLVLAGRDATSFRRALIRLNDRIRAKTAEGNAQPVLFVYYSGHADARALHLGGTLFELAELEQLVRGSAASFRVLLLDACRSGALTQVKGGTVGPPFPIEESERLEGEGVVFLASSAANEDAQESEAIGGSFFTHYFVSGLLGAADLNGDGKVGLREVYAHAYEQTLRASSRTLAGLQHPTFRYEIKGRGDLVLSEPYQGEARAILEFPEARGYLILGGSAEGPVIAEIGPQDRVRRLGLQPGKYFLRSRGRDHLLEGVVKVEPGARTITDEGLERIAYARLVRKGGGTLSAVHGPEAGYRVRGPLFAGESPCHGGYGGYGLDLAELSLSTELGVCSASFQNLHLTADTTELSWALAAKKGFDWAPLTLELGAALGAAWFVQRFETRGLAPTRLSFAPLLRLETSLKVDLGAGFYLAAQLGGVGYLLSQGSAFDAALALEGGGGLGKRW